MNIGATMEPRSEQDKDLASELLERSSNGARANGDRSDGLESEQDEPRDVGPLDPYEEERRARNGARRRFITY